MLQEEQRMRIRLDSRGGKTNRHHQQKQRGGTMALTKIDLVGLIQEEIGLTKKEGVASLDSLFQIMKDELIRGNPVKISGFGKWTVMKKHARKGRNPKSGESITIDARKVVSFKISNVLRQALSK
jgi:integration host factor subunit alpha